MLSSSERLADRYSIVGPLGRGSFAKTYLADDEREGRRVAVKILEPARAADLKSFELFEREGRVLRSLRHHAIPEVLDLIRVERNGAPVHCLVMEHIEGESLEAWIEAGRVLDRAAVTRLFAELIGVLDYLHSRVPPILHRDIKPANIIVRPDGSPALVDFGSVRAAIRVEDGSTVAGTYGYMPYEQYMGQAVPASDLYGLAATFLHLVTGSPPSSFLAESGQIEVPPLPCGEPLAGILRRLLRPAPNERYQSAGEVRDALLAPPGRTVSTLPGPIAPAPTRLALRRESVGLPEGPRAMTGATRSLYRKLAPGTWRMMNADSKPGGLDAGSVMLIGFFCVVTAGILPLWFWSLSGSRRKRLRPFFERGSVAPAIILGMAAEDVGFQVRLTRVRYEFEVEGRVIRGSDLVMPEVAERWQPGEGVEVLYLADRDFDSVIASTS
jgi:hypothetical protein